MNAMSNVWQLIIRLILCAILPLHMNSFFAEIIRDLPFTSQIPPDGDLRNPPILGGNLGWKLDNCLSFYHLTRKGMHQGVFVDRCPQDCVDALCKKCDSSFEVAPNPGDNAECGNNSSLFHTSGQNRICNCYKGHFLDDHYKQRIEIWSNILKKALQERQDTAQKSIETINNTTTAIATTKVYTLINENIPDLMAFLAKLFIIHRLISNQCFMNQPDYNPLQRGTAQQFEIMEMAPSSKNRGIFRGVTQIILIGINKQFDILDQMIKSSSTGTVEASCAIFKAHYITIRMLNNLIRYYMAYLSAICMQREVNDQRQNITNWIDKFMDKIPTRYYISDLNRINEIYSDQAYDYDNLKCDQDTQGSSGTDNVLRRIGLGNIIDQEEQQLKKWANSFAIKTTCHKPSPSHTYRCYHNPIDKKYSKAENATSSDYCADNFQPGCKNVCCPSGSPNCIDQCSTNFIKR